MFALLNLLSFINNVDYTAEYGSNHRGCFIDISDNIFDNKIQMQRLQRD